MAPPPPPPPVPIRKNPKVSKDVPTPSPPPPPPPASKPVKLQDKGKGKEVKHVKSKKKLSASTAGPSGSTAPPPADEIFFTVPSLITTEALASAVNKEAEAILEARSSTNLSPREQMSLHARVLRYKLFSGLASAVIRVEYKRSLGDSFTAHVEVTGDSKGQITFQPIRLDLTDTTAPVSISLDIANYLSNLSVDGLPLLSKDAAVPVSGLRASDEGMELLEDMMKALPPISHSPAAASSSSSIHPSADAPKSFTKLKKKAVSADKGPNFGESPANPYPDPIPLASSSSLAASSTPREHETPSEVSSSSSRVTAIPLTSSATGTTGVWNITAKLPSSSESSAPSQQNKTSSSAKMAKSSEAGNGKPSKASSSSKLNKKKAASSSQEQTEDTPAASSTATPKDSDWGESTAATPAPSGWDDPDNDTPKKSPWDVPTPTPEELAFEAQDAYYKEQHTWAPDDEVAAMVATPEYKAHMAKKNALKVTPFTSRQEAPDHAVVATAADQAEDGNDKEGENEEEEDDDDSDSDSDSEADGDENDEDTDTSQEDDHDDANDPPSQPHRASSEQDEEQDDDETSQDDEDGREEVDNDEEEDGEEEEAGSDDEDDADTTGNDSSDDNDASHSSRHSSLSVASSNDKHQERGEEDSSEPEEGDDASVEYASNQTAQAETTGNSEEEAVATGSDAPPESSDDDSHHSHPASGISNSDSQTPEQASSNWTSGMPTQEQVAAESAQDWAAAEASSKPVKEVTKPKKKREPLFVDEPTGATFSTVLGNFNISKKSKNKRKQAITNPDDPAAADTSSPSSASKTAAAAAVPVSTRAITNPFQPMTLQARASFEHAIATGDFKLTPEAAELVKQTTGAFADTPHLRPAPAAAPPKIKTRGGTLSADAMSKLAADIPGFAKVPQTPKLPPKPLDASRNKLTPQASSSSSAITPVQVPKAVVSSPPTAPAPATPVAKTKVIPVVPASVLPTPPRPVVHDSTATSSSSKVDESVKATKEKKKTKKKLSEPAASTKTGEVSTTSPIAKVDETVPKVESSSSTSSAHAPAAAEPITSKKQRQRKRAARQLVKRL